MKEHLYITQTVGECVVTLTDANGKQMPLRVSSITVTERRPPSDDQVLKPVEFTATFTPIERPLN